MPAHQPHASPQPKPTYLSGLTALALQTEQALNQAHAKSRLNPFALRARSRIVELRAIAELIAILITLFKSIVENSAAQTTDSTTATPHATRAHPTATSAKKLNATLHPSRGPNRAPHRLQPKSAGAAPNPNPITPARHPPRHAA